MEKTETLRPYKFCSAPIASGFQGPHIDSIEFEKVEDKNEALDLLEKGKFDFLDFPLIMEKDDKKLLRLQEYESEIFGFYFLGLNHRNEIINKKEIRKSLAYILNHAKKQIYKTSEMNQMDNITADVYGKVINPFIKTYNTNSLEEAIEVADHSIRHIDVSKLPDSTIYYVKDDNISIEIARSFLKILSKSHLKDKFNFVPISISQLLDKVYSKESSDWAGFIYFNHIMDNITSWKPGMFKTRYTPTFLGDFISVYSSLRNYAGLNNREYDKAAGKLFTVLYPYDIRPAVLTEGHLSTEWNNSAYWNKERIEDPKQESALFYAWKLQWIISEELPMIPLFMPRFKFIGNKNHNSVWNGFGEGSTHHGGVLSYWTFQKIKSNNNKIKVGLTGDLTGLNPLKATTYRDTLIWTRIYESLISLNPYLLPKGVAEDACHLANCYKSEIVDNLEYKQKLTFEIKDDVYWHDGQKFTIKDVAFTILSVLGEKGARMAAGHESTDSLIPLLSNKKAIPGWIDYYNYLHHIEIQNETTISLYLVEHFRWGHEWFGDLPILPSHIWSQFGEDYMNPVFRGVTGLENIENGMVGTGPFQWDFMNNKGLGGIIKLKINRDYYNLKSDF